MLQDISPIQIQQDIGPKQLLYYGIGVGLIYLISRFGNDRIYSGMWIFYGILIVFLVGLVIQRFAIYKLGMHIIPFAKDLNGATILV